MRKDLLVLCMAVLMSITGCANWSRMQTEASDPNYAGGKYLPLARQPTGDREIIHDALLGEGLAFEGLDEGMSRYRDNQVDFSLMVRLSPGGTLGENWTLVAELDDRAWLSDRPAVTHKARSRVDTLDSSLRSRLPAWSSLKTTFGSATSRFR